MSRWVQDGDRIVPRSLVEPWDIKPGDCPYCGGTGERPECIDEERYDVMMACPMCQEFCKACDRYVKKGGHECKRQ
jgi:hypothetical protein